MIPRPYHTAQALLVLVLCVVACDTNGGIGGPEPPEASDLAFRSISFTLVDGRRVGAEEADLMVPEDRRDLDGARIRLRVLRFNSTASDPEPPLVFLAGGPGDVGTEIARWLYLGLFDAVLPFSDVIVLDQRGTGASSPNLDCNRTVVLSPQVLGNREALVNAFIEPSRACAQFWQGEGVRLQAYNTVENADDIEALRVGLGVEQVSLLGISYGTHLALAFARRHPAHVHQMVLAGVEGPDHTLKLPSNTQAQLAYIDQLVQDDPDLNGLIPDFLGLLDGLLAQLADQPVTVEVADPQTGQATEVVVTRFMLQFLISQNLGFARDVRTVPALLYGWSQGAYTEAAQAILALDEVALPSAMTFMMDCASGASSARRAQINEEIPETLLGDALNLPFPDVCTAWDASDLGPSFRAPVQVDTRTLVVSGTLDGRTPVSNGNEVLQGLPNGTHLILENGGHDILDDWFTIPAYKDAVITFLRGEPLPTTRITLPFDFVVPE